MFCKWCGADIPDSVSKCQRCGKEVPPLSDCGGFYDLVPGAKQSTVLIEECQTPVRADAHKDNEASKTPVKSRKNDGRKLRNILLAILCIGLCAVLLFITSLRGQVKDCLAAIEKNADRIDSMQSSLFDIQNAIPTVSSTEPTPPTMPDDNDRASLTEQDIEIRVDVSYSKAGITASTAVDLKDCIDTATDKLTFHDATGMLSHIQIDFSEAEKCLEGKIENKLDSSSKRRGTLSFDCAVDAEVFGRRAGAVQYQWQFWDPEYNDWKDLDEDIFTVSSDGKAISYFIRDVEDMLADEDDRVVFRLSFLRNNVDGGSMTVIISGIAITKEEIENKFL